MFDEDEWESDDLIGFCSIKVSSLIVNAPLPNQKGHEISNFYTLFLSNEPAGKLKITTLYFDGVVEECPKEPTLERKIELATKSTRELESKL